MLVSLSCFPLDWGFLEDRDFTLWHRWHPIWVVYGRPRNRSFIQTVLYLYFTWFLPWPYLGQRWRQREEEGRVRAPNVFFCHLLPKKAEENNRESILPRPAPELNVSFWRMKNPIPTQWVPVNPGELCLVLLTLSHGVGKGLSQTKVLSPGVECVYLCLAKWQDWGWRSWWQQLRNSYRKGTRYLRCVQVRICPSGSWLGFCISAWWLFQAVPNSG